MTFSDDSPSVTTCMCLLVKNVLSRGSNLVLSVCLLILRRSISDNLIVASGDIVRSSIFAE